MAIVFDFEAGKGFHFTSAFARHFETEATGDRVFLPGMLGNGFIQEVYLDNGLSLCLHHYTLQQELILRRHGTGATEVLTMKFDGRRVAVRSKDGPQQPLFAGRSGCEVQFGTSNFFSEVTIPPNEQINFLVVVTTRRSLLDLLQLKEDTSAIGNTIRENPSFFLYEGMTREMERTLKRISLIDETTNLSGLLYQIRTQELIYLLFATLLSRKTGVSLSVDEEDVKKLYQVRAILLADLSVPPYLPELARKIGMSQTKMKQLFRQTFGDSIYNYFQVERMNEAARLLRNLSVSQVGYQVGFSNLSHFTRIFEKHHQIKPKRYKDALEELP
ncbi:MAG TPA: AraC family transcriptional regulator [Puia sp.]|nr:AraC family transcriptional regulator [Puia sp.]